MKIISRVKDYYDYVGHQMGMIDPKIVYDRNKKIINNEESNFLLNKLNPYPFSTGRLYIMGLDLKFLCVNGKLVTLYNLMNNDRFYRVITKEIFEQYFYKVFYYKQSYEFSPFEKSKLVDELSISIQQPVFLISNGFSQKRHSNYIEENIPILKNHNYQSIQSPQELYQDIEHYITNFLRTNPDILVPVEVADKNKITQHGFDIKKSFRHRK